MITEASDPRNAPGSIVRNGRAYTLAGENSPDRDERWWRSVALNDHRASPPAYEAHADPMLTQYSPVTYSLPVTRLASIRYTPDFSSEVLARRQDWRVRSIHWMKRGTSAMEVRVMSADSRSAAGASACPTATEMPSHSPSSRISRRVWKASMSVRSSPR